MQFLCLDIFVEPSDGFNRDLTKATVGGTVLTQLQIQKQGRMKNGGFINKGRQKKKSVLVDKSFMCGAVRTDACANKHGACAGRHIKQ
jgi:hypothetical protein